MSNKGLLVIAILLLTVLTLPTAGIAADSSGKYMVRGVGSVPCSQLVGSVDAKNETLRKEAVLLYTSWLNGYLTYVNRVEKGTYDMVPLVDGAHLLAVVAGQCRRHPDALVETISGDVVKLLSKAKIATESPLVTLTVGGQKGRFHRATLVDLQERLIAGNYLAGKADGIFGANSQQALQAYQKAEGLKVTGFPDTDTMIHLLLK